MRMRLPAFEPILVSVLLAAAPARAGNWPQWRGPDGTGVSDETGLPLVWSEDVGIVWTCALPEWGMSTPAVWGDAIFVTTHEGRVLALHRIDKATGRRVWSRRVGEGTSDRMKLRVKKGDERRRQKFHNLHNMASPSPITDGQRVVVHFGNGDLAAYDFDGNRLWRHNLQEEHGTYTVWWGHANSPVFHDDLVISVCMQDSLADLTDRLSPSYVVAHDKRTGEQKWKTMRMTGATTEACDAYTTPVFRKAAGRTEMIVFGATQVDGYDPATGERLWFLPDLGGNRVITSPTVAHGLVYGTVGMRGPLLAMKLGGSGKLGKNAIQWQHTRGTPDAPSPVVAGDLVFTVSDNGIAHCLDARTGKIHWNQRLRGGYRASPLAADGRIYFVNMDGLCTVVAAGREFKPLAENQLDAQLIASPAVSDGRIFLRGRKNLYCIGQ